MTQMNGSLISIGVVCSLQKDIFKKEMDHDEVFEDTLMNKKHEWKDYVKNDVLCTDFGNARYSKRMGEDIGFGKINRLKIFSL